MKGAPIHFVELGKLLKEAREHRKMSQSEAAMMLGLKPIYLYRVETGRSSLSLPKLRRALELYQLPKERAVEFASLDFQATMLEALA